MKFGVYAALLASAVIAKKGQQKFELQEKKEQLLKQLNEVETLINLAEVDEAKAILVENQVNGALITTLADEVTAPETPAADTAASDEVTLADESGQNKITLTFEVAGSLGIIVVVFNYLKKKQIVNFEGGEQQ